MQTGRAVTVCYARDEQEAPVGETLSRFIAASVEFIVGGILLCTSLLLVLIQVPDVRSGLDTALGHRWIADIPHGALAVFGLCIAYAVGIFAESSSRILLERRLDSITAKQFSPEPVVGAPRRLGKVKREQAQKRREQARLNILLQRANVYREIESQLRRMRLERIWFLSLGLFWLSSFAHALVTHTWTWIIICVVTMAALAVSFLVVNERFVRFCTAINELKRGLPPMADAPPSDHGSRVNKGWMRGAVFDLDGVLVDSERLWTQAYKQFVEHTYSERLTDEEARKFEGGRVRDTVVNLLTTFGKMDPAEAEAEAEAIAQQLIDQVQAWFRDEGEPLTASVRTLEQLHEAGVKIAIASSSHKDFITTALDVCGIAEIVDARVSAYDLPRGKPDPLVYQIACLYLGLRPEDCVAVEDSLNGVCSALQAEIPCFCLWRKPEPPPEWVEEKCIARKDELGFEVLVTAYADRGLGSGEHPAAAQ